MKALDTGNEKVKKICEALREEALEPARIESEAILRKAKSDAALIVQHAHDEAKKILSETKAQIEQERNVFDASLKLAAKQSVSSLKQMIEKHILNSRLSNLLSGVLDTKHMLADFVRALLKGVEKSGIHEPLQIILPREAKAEELVKILEADFIEALRKGSITIGTHPSGVKISIPSEQMTLDFSEEAVREMLAYYVREDLRASLFQSPSYER